MRILVVEDDYLLADQLAAGIRELGHSVVGPFPDAGRAMRYLELADAAILDIRLGSGTSFPIADALSASELPFLFLTGYDPAIVPARFQDARVYSKPGPVARMLDDLHSRRPAPLCDPDGGITRDLLAEACRLMPDRPSAERLVEAALRAAIGKKQRGEGEADLRPWLSRLMEQEYRYRRRNHLH